MTDQYASERRAAIRADYAAEEAANAEAEALEGEQTVLSVRVPGRLAERLKQRANAEHTQMSSLVRSLLVHALDEDTTVTVSEVEDIARRVAREELRDAG